MTTRQRVAAEPRRPVAESAPASHHGSTGHEGSHLRLPQHSIQALKLARGQDEREADAVAEHVVAGTAIGPIHRLGGGAGPAEDPTSSLGRAMGRAGPGRPLAPALQGRMERSFGVDFSTVRVHRGAAAETANHVAAARAFTWGTHIYLGRNESPHDVRLMAHELTHVVQQSLSPQAPPRIQRQTRGEDELSRTQEIRQSRTSPGRASLDASGTLSLHNFSIDGDRPKAEHRALLLELATLLRDEASTPLRVRVIGHASNPGDVGHNAGLSQRRADRIAEILRGHGLAGVEVHFAGEAAPVVSNDTVDGRSRNRRVDITISPVRLPTPVPGPEPGPEPPGPGSEPPGPGPEPPPPRTQRDFCDRFPLLCGLVPPIPFPFPIPFPWPVLCALVPELCALWPCIVDPAACIPVPPDPPDPPRRRRGPLWVDFDHIRASNTPSAMGDRIPNQGTTAVGVRVHGWRPPMDPIRIAPLFANTANGTVEIDGASERVVTASTTVHVGGQRQTSPAVAGFPLFLQARMGAAIIGQSWPFAVSSIMEDMRTGLGGVVDEPDRLGLHARMSWRGDGAGGVASLGELEFEEQLTVVSESGGLVGLGLGDFGDYLLGSIMPQDDRHLTPRAAVRRVGHQVIQQTWAFLDGRTGEAGIPVTRSGFEVRRDVQSDPRRPGCLRFVTAKQGRAGTGAGFHSDAGAGSALAVIELPCGSRGRGGGGGVPATPTTPRPHHGPIPQNRIPLSYVDGLPRGAARGGLHTITVAFQVDGEVFTSPLPCVVVGRTDTHVLAVSRNLSPLNIGPQGKPVVVAPQTRLRIPIRRLR